MRWIALGVLGIATVVAYIGFFYAYDIDVSGGMTSRTSLFLTELTTTYPMKCDVVELNRSDVAIGVAVDTDRLDFGMLIAGSSGSTRTVNIGNNEDVPVKIRLSADGSIAPYVDFGENNFVLDVGEGRTVNIRMSSDEPGNYTGTLFISAKKVNYGWMEGITPAI